MPQNVLSTDYEKQQELKQLMDFAAELFKESVAPEIESEVGDELKEAAKQEVAQELTTQTAIEDILTALKQNSLAQIQNFGQTDFSPAANDDIMIDNEPANTDSIQADAAKNDELDEKNSKNEPPVENQKSSIPNFNPNQAESEMPNTETPNRRTLNEKEQRAMNKEQVEPEKEQTNSEEPKENRNEQTAATDKPAENPNAEPVEEPQPAEANPENSENPEESETEPESEANNPESGAENAENKEEEPSDQKQDGEEKPKDGEESQGEPPDENRETRDESQKTNDSEPANSENGSPEPENQNSEQKERSTPVQLINAVRNRKQIKEVKDQIRNINIKTAQDAKTLEKAKKDLKPLKKAYDKARNLYHLLLIAEYGLMLLGALVILFLALSLIGLPLIGQIAPWIARAVRGIAKLKKETKEKKDAAEKAMIDGKEVQAVKKAEEQIKTDRKEQTAQQKKLFALQNQGLMQKNS